MRSVVDRLSSRSSARRRFGLVALLVVAAVTAFVFSTIRADGELTSPWWPAAAISSLAFFLSRGATERMLVLLGVVVFMAGANYVGGTPLWMALVYGVINAVEVAIVGSLLPTPHPPATFGVRVALRIVLACLAGSVFIALCVTLIALAVGHEAPMLVGYSVVASHFSAATLLLPFAFVSSSFFRTRRPSELAVQAAAGLVVIGIMFIPDQRFALTFLIFPVLMWLVLRFPTGVVLIEVAAVCVASALALSLSAAFADVTPIAWTPFIQAFWAAITTTCLIFSGLRNDQAEAELQLRARDDLLQSGIVDTHAGFLCLAPSTLHPGSFEVMDSNPQARVIFGDVLDDADGGVYLRSGNEVAEVVRAALGDSEDHQATLRAADGHTVMVRSRRVHNPRIGNLAVVEAMDVTQQLEEEERWERTLSLERASTRQRVELDRQKDVFIESVNHELRAPVTNILAHADLLVQEPLTDRARRRVEVILRNAERLTTLINDVMATTRNALVLPEPVTRSVDVAKLVRDAVEDIAPDARTRTIGIRLKASEPTFVETSMLDVQQILGNLIGNAVKFATPATLVSVAVRDAAGRVSVEIANHGHPLSEEELARVFERFYRAPHAVANAVQGSGVGLSIARALAERIGADVSLDSDAGGITVATLRFPHPV
jgi:signal transduction histidine kinase